MSEIKQFSIDHLPATHRHEQEQFEYFRKKVVPYGASRNTVVSVYEIPPHKSAYPYHYHHKNEETFFILSGNGILKTPQGERTVSAGDFLFFPTGPQGAHRITNSSDTENLVYIDFDTVHDLDIAIYPDSDKIGIWGMGINKIYPSIADVDYYQGETE